uniref:Methyltransf_25 domain-containing protein n=1 Tax=Macrostomum lignano TaxID=282301 RepID=A0A1I8HHF8_9PLAT
PKQNRSAAFTMSNEATAESIAAAGPDVVVDRIDAFLDDRKLTQEQVADVYNRWSSTYEADLARVPLGYNNPKQLVDAFAKVMPPGQQCRILDVACGTGLVGERLRQLGYQRVDGIDGSEQMLETARRKGIYDGLHCELIGDQLVKCVPPRTYDALLTTGSFCPNHLAPSCLRTPGRAGGIVGLAIRKEFLSTDPVLCQLEPEMDKLQAEGVWQPVLREERECYYGDQAGMFYLLRVN